MAQSVPSLEDALPWGLFANLTYAVFTVEYLLRLLVYEGSTCKFLFEPLNVVDFIAIAPFIVEEAILAILALSNRDDDAFRSSSVLRLLRVVRLFRLARLLRLAQYNTDLKIVAECMYRSRAALYTLFAMLALSIVIFSSLM